MILTFENKDNICPTENPPAYRFGSNRQLYGSIILSRPALVPLHTGTPRECQLSSEGKTVQCETTTSRESEKTIFSFIDQIPFFLDFAHFEQNIKSVIRADMVRHTQMTRSDSCSRGRKLSDRHLNFIFD